METFLVRREMEDNTSYEAFYLINENGTVGNPYDNPIVPTVKDLAKIMEAIERNRSKLQSQLIELREAEKVVHKMRGKIPCRS